MVNELDWLRTFIKDAEASPRLNDWEKDFVQNIKSYHARMTMVRLSAKQREIINRIEDKIYAAG